ncbi:hypothetical protein [Yoonia sp.]|uniref:hypothetical protein n=1 Tax=Yoonia sp. TaxID=2212373 RepID=UPI0023B7471F
MLKPDPESRHLLGIDVGTGSARAGVFTSNGRMVGTDKCPIAIYRKGGTIVEQSSDGIWSAVVTSVSDPSHPERNIMVWTNHRALEQAERINRTDCNQWRGFKTTFMMQWNRCRFCISI